MLAMPETPSATPHPLSTHPVNFYDLIDDVVIPGAPPLPKLRTAP